MSKEKPTAHNDIYDHDARDIKDAVGIDRETFHELLMKDKRLHELMLDAAGGLEHGSRCVEHLANIMSKKQLAAVLMASMKKQLNEDPVSSLMLSFRAARKREQRAQQN